MTQEYRVRLLLSERCIRTEKDVIHVSYVIYAPDRNKALNYAYELADEEFPEMLVIHTEIDPMFN